jgi:hypothetical protein
VQIWARKLGRVLFETLCAICGPDSDEEAVGKGKIPTVEAFINISLQMTGKRYGHSLPGRFAQNF